MRRHYVEEAEGFFRPEFFNRLDRVVAFRTLDEATVRRIARRELGRLLLREGVVRRRLLVEIDGAVVEALARRGFHPRYGARPLQREVERAVIRPLAQLLVEQRPHPGDLVRVHLRDGEVAVEIRRVELPAAPRAERRRREPPEDTSLARAAAEVEELVQRIEAEEATAAVSQLRAEKSGLVSETHEPAFWDEPDTARNTLLRIYQVGEGAGAPGRPARAGARPAGDGPAPASESRPAAPAGAAPGRRGDRRGAAADPRRAGGGGRRR
ncbi:MAG: hypothetical protein JF924_11150 [Candidatus Dormibacteraeota bacterium]|nr:hypothetical protein [Candidatus Dormibacteraeota bacterium]